jgi:hypothetical protein
VCVCVCVCVRARACNMQLFMRSVITNELEKRRNKTHLAELMTVPPLCMMSCTSLQFISMMFSPPSTNPLYPLIMAKIRAPLDRHTPTHDRTAAFIPGERHGFKRVRNIRVCVCVCVDSMSV